jgi:hypothetical protein
MLQAASTSPAREREGPKNKRLQRNVRSGRVEEEGKKRPRVAESRREKRDTRARACSLYEENTRTY